MPQVVVPLSKESYAGGRAGAYVDPRDAGLEGGALRRLGAAGVEIFGDIVEKQERARKLAYMSQLEMSAHKELTDLQIAADRDTDFQNAPHRFRDGASKVRDKYLKSIPNDDLKLEFGISFDRMLLPKDVEVRRSAFKREVDHGQFQLEVALDEYATALVNSKNDAERAQTQALADKAIARAAAAGFIREDDAYKKRRGFLSKIDEITVRRGLIGDAGVESTVQALWDPTRFTNLTEEKRVQLQTAAQNRLTAVMTKRDIAERRAERYAEKALRERQSATSITMMERMYSQEGLTTDQVFAAGRSQQINEADVKFLLGQMEKSDSVKTDPNTMLNILLRIDDPEGLDMIKEAASEGRLGKADIRSLMNQWKTASKGDMWKTADQKFHAQELRRTLGAEGFNVDLNKDDAARISSALLEYRQRVVIEKEDPKAVFEDIKTRYIHPSFNEYNILPIPRGSEVRPTSTADLAVAAQKLIDLQQTGQITPQAYEREKKIIEKYQRHFDRVGNQPRGTGAPARSGGERPKVIPRSN